MPVIKRYPNRKLYDTEAKRYVTLDNITQLIQQGQEILVIDHETGEDLTNLTLSQIIFEQEKKGSGLMSRSLLTNLIRAGGDTIDQMKRALLRGAEAGDPREVAAEKVTEPSPLQRVDEIFQDVLHTLNVPTNRELQQLQQQLDELNMKIGAILAQGPPVNDASESPSDPAKPNEPP
ncbi:MAG: polyhydroxyalkanoate synthesis regulator DNA-binding domain-containing protein [Anaerolineales bacterium]|nr:polyhydroxyalkanoate synthesis regulator DNA-binding domain-containing protein [Anaerolineales bacterium]